MSNSNTLRDVRLSGFGDRVPLSTAWAWVDAWPVPSSAEIVPVAEAMGRVLAKPITAGIEPPAPPRAAENGYAVRAADCDGASEYNPLLLSLLEPGASELTPGFACLIGSGLAIPSGADAVLPFEAAQTVSPRSLEVLAPVASGTGIGQASPAGIHLGRGQNIGPLHVGWLAAMGIESVAVLCRPRVALVVSRAKSGPDALTPMLRALLTRDGALAEPIAVASPGVGEAGASSAGETAPGEPAPGEPAPGDTAPGEAGVGETAPGASETGAGETGAGETGAGETGAGQTAPGETAPGQSALAARLTDDRIAACGLVLIAGRAGTGPDDVASLAVQAAGGTLTHHGLALHPGGSTGLGILPGSAADTIPVVLLPGEPLACLFAYDIVASRLVRRLAGAAEASAYRTAEFELARKIVSGIGLVEVVPVRLDAGRAVPIGVEAGLGGAIRADGYVIVPGGSEGYLAGARIRVHLYDWRPMAPETVL